MKIKETIKAKAEAVKDFVVRHEDTLVKGATYCTGIIVGGICTAIGFKGGIQATCDGLYELAKKSEGLKADGDDSEVNQAD